MLEWVPLWALVVGTIVLVLGAQEFGHLLGRVSRAHPKEEKESPTGAISGAILGLLALMLAFTFGMAADRFHERRILVREEAAAIERTWLRTDFLPDSAAAASAQLLRAYVEHRIITARAIDSDELPARIAEARVIHARLWAIVAGTPRLDVDSELGALYVDALNDLIDLHAKRTSVALYARIPGGIWELLFVLIAASLAAVGYHSSIAGSRRSWTTVILACSLALVIGLIGALDRPDANLIRVSQQPLVDVRDVIVANPRSR